MIAEVNHCMVEPAAAREWLHESPLLHSSLTLQAD